MLRFCLLVALILIATLANSSLALAAEPPAVKPARPAQLIFDTDVGNDIDDVLALGVIHALESRGACKLLAVTLSKDNRYCPPFVDLINTFYGRGDIPIGMVRGGREPADGKFLKPVCDAQDAGKPRYPRDVTDNGATVDAVELLRRTLAAAEDRSVTMVVVGFSTNIARLLDSPADQHSPLTGSQLVARKCKLLSMMAGMFEGAGRHKEYNVFIDLEVARKVFRDWPTPIVASGFEIGEAIKYPASSITGDFGYVAHHPLAEAYELYMPMPYDRETWDLTSVLYAVYPDRDYFGLSPAGNITVDQQEITQFSPAADGRCKYLTVSPEQIARVREALIQLASQPPDASASKNRSAQ